MSCEDYPTAQTAKTFKLDAETVNEVVTLEQDRTSEASDGKTKKTLWGIENDATNQRDEFEQLAETQRENLESTFTAQFAYKRIGNISDYIGDTLQEANKLNSYQHPDDSGEWYGAVQDQAFPITIPADPSIDDNWSLVNAVTTTSVGGLTNYQASSVDDMINGITTGGKSIDIKMGQRWVVEDYHGGATPNNSGVLFFKVVAAGTGTADGGKRIDVPGGVFQLEQILRSAPYDSRAWGVRGISGIDDSSSFLSAISYVESVTSKERMQELYFDVLNLSSQVVINNYSAPFILRGNKIYDEYEVNEPCLVYGEDLSSNGVYEFQIKNFNIENRTSLVPTKTLGFLVYHSAYHVGVGVTTRGFQVGHEIVSCIGADYDMQCRTSINESTNFLASMRAPSTRKNNLVKYRNHKHKLTGSSGTAWIIEDGGGLDIQNQIHDVLPQGCRPFRLSRCYEQTKRNTNKIFGGWSENYGEVPPIIEDSVVDMEQHFFSPRNSIDSEDPNQTLEYCVNVTGENSVVNARNVTTTTTITSHIFNLDTATMTDKNILLSTFDNVSGGVAGGVEVKPSNVASSNGSQDGFSIELLGNVEANGYVFDLDAQLQAANLPVATDFSNSSIEIEFSGGAGLTNVSLKFARYSLGVTKNSGAYNCENVIGGVGASIAPITVTFPSPRKPIFTFDSTTSGWQNLTAHFRFVRQSSRFQ